MTKYDFIIGLLVGIIMTTIRMNREFRSYEADKEIILNFLKERDSFKLSELINKHNIKINFFNRYDIVRTIHKMKKNNLLDYTITKKTMSPDPESIIIKNL